MKSLLVISCLLAAPRGAAAPPVGPAIDAVVTREMTDRRVPAVVVSVVKDGRVVFAQGYGVTDLETKRPVSPERTIFRIGSITKVFTAAAALQLADRGSVSMHEDVNAYLQGIAVAGAYPEPLTLEHLLTHTGGLDEILPGRRAPTQREVQPLARFLSTRLVRRQPPGLRASYSTYGISLAGLVVESVSGQVLGDYVEANFFRPLGMARSSLGAVPTEDSADVAVGYELDADQLVPAAWEWHHTYPASDINSTASDMSRFLIALIDGDQRLFSPGAHRDLLSRHFTNHPRLPGWTYGLGEDLSGGRRALWHGGSMAGYSALLYFVPEERLGLFVAATSETEGPTVAEAVKKAVLNAFAPPRAASPALEPAVEIDLEPFAGNYRWDVYCHSCPPSARGWFPDLLSVTARSDGTLAIWDTIWRPIGPLLFQATDDAERFVAFGRDGTGRITHLFARQDTFERER